MLQQLVMLTSTNFGFEALDQLCHISFVTFVTIIFEIQLI